MQTDEDVEFMDRRELKAEVRKLRNVIRNDMNNSGHDLCHYRPELWSVLPDYQDVKPKIPPFWEWMWRCFIYRKNLCKGGCCG